MKNFYITTAIDYANGSPHLGHAYEKVLADVVARSRRLGGTRVHFLTGLDEHGQKVQQTAARQGVDPQQFCDDIAELFQGLCRDLNISNSDFIRTTERRHKDVVQRLLQELYDRGEIYKAEYTGYYSTRAEQFLQEKDKVDGRWPEIFGEVVEISESNYFFRLNKYQEWLIEHIQSNDHFIYPRFRQKQVLEFLREPINDLCISRPVERLSWGIPLPFDTNYVAYVWFDALVNYISAIGYGEQRFAENWPADMHVIGKDILVPPHAVYWPIMLKAAGLPLPKTLVVHGWWQSESGEKMSKSLGNAVNPLDLVERFGADAFRYFLIREMNVGQDSNFSGSLFLSRYNSDLGNDLGNLVSRLLNMLGRYVDGVIPVATVKEDPETELQAQWNQTVRSVLDQYESLLFHSGLETLFTFIRGINRYAEVRAPWKLAKSVDPADRQRLETALATMAEALRLAAALIAPVMPNTADRIQESLGEPVVSEWQGRLEWSDHLAGKTVGKPVILFPRPNEE